MAASRHLFLLGLGLCLVLSHSFSEEIKVYGGDAYNAYEDVTWQLEKQRTDKQKLEKLLAVTTDENKKISIQKSIDKITSAIAKMEVKFRVVYKDHIAAIKDKTQNLEDEKAKMKKELDAAEERHAKAVADMQEAKKNDIEQIGAYQAKLEESTTQVGKLERDYAALKEIQTQQLEKEKEEKEQLIKVRDELTKKLQQAQELHAKAMEAISLSVPRENVKVPSSPHGNEIIALEKTIIAVLQMPDIKKRIAGLITLQKAVRALYEKLYEESHLPRNVAHKELEKALSRMKMNTEDTLIEQTNRRAALEDQVKKTKLGDYTEEQIEALQKATEEVNASNLFLREIARRKTYLRSIKQVGLLITKLTDAAKYIK